MSETIDAGLACQCVRRLRAGSSQRAPAMTEPLGLDFHPRFDSVIIPANNRQLNASRTIDQREAATEGPSGSSAIFRSWGGAMEPTRTTDESMRNFVAEALAQDPEASSGDIAVRWRSRQGEAVSAHDLELLTQEYNRQAPAAHEGNAGRRAAQARIDSPPFRVTKREIAGLVAVLLPFVLPVETINAAARTYFSFGGVIGGIVGIGLALAILQFAIRSESAVGVKMGHAALGVIVLLLGAYHLLHGFGVLHTLGVYRF